MSKKYYYSLKCKGSNSFHHKGKVYKFSERTVNIGETSDCDIQYEPGKYQPEYYATIIRNDDSKSWRIVQRSEHVQTSIMGKGSIGYVHQLSDGDIISFDNQGMSLSFQTHNDNMFEKDRSHVILNWILTLFICGLFSSLFIFNQNNKEEIISEEEIAYLEESLFLLRVDSVCHIQIYPNGKEKVLHKKVLSEEIPTGTAFLTTDGRIVTARHCVEYWLGMPLDLTSNVMDMSDDDVIKWAIETETFNQENSKQADGRQFVFVSFTLFNTIGTPVYSFSTRDKNIHMCKENDGVYLMSNLSDTTNHYWRSIHPYFENKDMALDDILWIDNLHEKGKIKLADKEAIEGIKRSSPIIICGYSLNESNDRQIYVASGTITKKVASLKENLFIEANINHGYSGAPVLRKLNNEIYAVGVVSRVDSTSGGIYKWAVPISMIN